jgi:hypothetical protein
MKRFASRKFIVALIAQLAGVAVLIWPTQAQGIVEAADAITALIVVVLSALGYLSAEASVDRARASAHDTTTAPPRNQTPAH